MLGVAFVMLFPILYMLSTALKPNVYTLEVPPQLIPPHPTLQNFATAWNSNNFGRYFLNSLLVAAVSTVCTVVVATTGAYSFARLRFPGQSFVFGLYLVFMTIPTVLNIVPQFLLARNLGLLNSLLGLIVFYVAGSVPFHTFLLRGFFEGVPREIEEAAQIDGATRWQSLLRIVLPLAAPAIGTSAILAFLGNWDEFTLALTFISDESRRTLPIAIQLFRGQFASNWSQIFAASLIALLPIAVVYVLFQRVFVRAVDTGAVKG